MVTRKNLVQGILILSAFGVPAVAQAPGQFKAAMKMKNGADGSTAAGSVYFGGAKVRTELSMDGQDIIVLADPTAKTQYVLMPSEKMYMQMPIGQGPVSIPITGPSDPTNPCSGGSGNTDCVKGEREKVNGYDAVRWDYSNAEGVQTRAWVSTKLRFPIKSEDDNGSSMELSNIAEGPQPASLFGIPAGYKKMDMGVTGGIGSGGGGGGGGGGRGRSNANDPMASMMSNLPPEAQAAMAAAMRGQGPRGQAGPTGSGWEKQKGWIVDLTINATSSKNSKTEAVDERETYTAKLVTSIPMNVGSPALGVPGSPGPRWQLIYTDIMGTPEALATPITYNAELTGRIDRSWKGVCGGEVQEDPGTAVVIVKGSARFNVPVKQRTSGDGAETNLRISADLKSYELAVAAGMDAKETKQTHTDTKACGTGRPSSSDRTESSPTQYAFTLDLKDQPLPATVGPISGSKKMPMQIGGHPMDATVTWTISPIR